VFKSLGAKLIAKKSEYGAQTGVFLAASREVAGISGKYFIGCHDSQSSNLSYNRSNAAKLWQES